MSYYYNHMVLLLLFIFALTVNTQSNGYRQETTGSSTTSQEQWQSSPIITLQAIGASREVYVERAKRLLQDVEEQRREKNEEAFKSLREGLGDWQGKPQHLRKNNAHKALEKMEIINKANKKESVFEPQQYDPQQDLREATLIDQQEAPLPPTQQSKPKPKPTSSLSSVFSTFLVLKWAQRCLRSAPRVQAQHEQSESLTDL